MSHSANGRPPVFQAENESSILSWDTVASDHVGFDRLFVEEKYTGSIPVCHLIDIDVFLLYNV